MSVRKPLLVAVALLESAVVAGAESLVTIRVGEQDTCKVNGVTTVQSDPRASEATIRFDLSKVKIAGEVKEAKLRFWVRFNDRSRGGLAPVFSVKKWEDPKFDGFKVWQVGGAAEPLDTFYPFESATYGCHEWDVTGAVQAWLKDPASNKGLKTNFRLPANDYQPAWRRAYLQITYAGDTQDKPKPPAAFKAIYRSGQVFMTWKQIPYAGAFFDSSYRIYRHTEPITARNLDKAELIGEVHKNSQLNYRRCTFWWDGLMAYGPYRHIWPYLRERSPEWKGPGRISKGEMMAEAHKILPKRSNFIIDDKWIDTHEKKKVLTDGNALGKGTFLVDGPQLSDGTGLFVRTVEKPGRYFYAVTSVIEGYENRTDLSAGNSLTKALDVKVEAPRPVLQYVLHFNMPKKHTKDEKSGRTWTTPAIRQQLRMYTYWDGNGKDYHNEPSTPLQFQMTPPGRSGSLWSDKIDISKITISAGSWLNGPVAGDTNYVPPTRLAPFPALRISLNRDMGHWAPSWRYYYGSKTPPTAADDEAKALAAAGLKLSKYNAFGWHDRMNTGKDPRQAIVRPYLELRVVKELEWYVDAFPGTDRNRFFISGQKALLNLAIHQADKIASVSSAMDVPFSAKRADWDWMYMGKRAWNLKVPQGYSVWDWNDPVWYSKKFPEKDWPFVSTVWSPNYSRADNFYYWKDCGYPEFYRDLAKEKRGGRWWWCDIGDAPDGGGHLVPLNEAYPGFSNVNFCEKPNDVWKQEPRGTLNGYLSWGPNERFLKGALRAVRKDPEALKQMTAAAEAMKTVDTPERFEMAIRIGEHGRRLNGQSVPPTIAKFGKADVTFNRLQQFKVEAGKTYRWVNKKVLSGQVLQTGTIKPDHTKRLTVPGVLIDRDGTGNKLIITPEAGAAPTVIAADAAVKVALPRVKKAHEVIELAYADYVKQCRNPVMYSEVKLPSTTFKISEFTGARNVNADGSKTSHGGGFGMGGIGTTVKLPEKGRYMLALRMKATRGTAANNWLVVIPLIGGKYTRADKTPVLVDTPELSTYRWFFAENPGKLDILFDTGHDYYFTAQLAGKNVGRSIHWQDMTIERIPDATAATKVYDIRLAPRGVAIPAGLPTRFITKTLNGLGKDIDAPVSFNCKGLTIDAKGFVKDPKPGTYSLTATAGDVSRTIPVEVADAYQEFFNEGSGTLRRGWEPADLGVKYKGTWGTPSRGHFLLTSLWQSYKRPVQSMLLWTPGEIWQDCEIKTDIFIHGKSGFPIEGTRGLVIRAKDKDNHYRLEVQRSKDSNKALLLKRVNGTESVLAESKEIPGYLPLDFKTNPATTGWAKLERVTAENYKDFHLERLKLSAKGDVIRVTVNGKEVFPDGVKDSDLATGMPGLYSAHRCAFDNVVVKAIQ